MNYENIGNMRVYNTGKRKVDKGKEQARKKPTHSEPAYDAEYYQPIGDAEWKQQAGTNTPENDTDKDGYMAKPGQPRQPRTQENKKGTLRYEEETETWNCTRCAKSFAK